MTEKAVEAINPKIVAINAKHAEKLKEIYQRAENRKEAQKIRDELVATSAKEKQKIIEEARKAEAENKRQREIKRAAKDEERKKEAIARYNALAAKQQQEFMAKAQRDVYRRQANELLRQRQESEKTRILREKAAGNMERLRLATEAANEQRRFRERERRLVELKKRVREDLKKADAKKKEEAATAAKILKDEKMRRLAASETARQKERLDQRMKLLVDKYQAKIREEVRKRDQQSYLNQVRRQQLVKKAEGQKQEGEFKVAQTKHKTGVAQQILDLKRQLQAAQTAAKTAQDAERAARQKASEDEAARKLEAAKQLRAKKAEKRKAEKEEKQAILKEREEQAAILNESLRALAEIRNSRNADLANEALASATAKLRANSEKFNREHAERIRQAKEKDRLAMARAVEAQKRRDLKGKEGPKKSQEQKLQERWRGVTEFNKRNEAMLNVMARNKIARTEEVAEARAAAISTVSEARTSAAEAGIEAADKKARAAHLRKIRNLESKKSMRAALDALEAKEEKKKAEKEAKKKREKEAKAKAKEEADKARAEAKKAKEEARQAAVKAQLEQKEKEHTAALEAQKKMFEDQLTARGNEAVASAALAGGAIEHRADVESLAKVKAEKKRGDATVATKMMKAAAASVAKEEADIILAKGRKEADERKAKEAKLSAERAEALRKEEAERKADSKRLKREEREAAAKADRELKERIAKANLESQAERDRDRMLHSLVKKAVSKKSTKADLDTILGLLRSFDAPPAVISMLSASSSSGEAASSSSTEPARKTLTDVEKDEIVKLIKSYRADVLASQASSADAAWNALMQMRPVPARSRAVIEGEHQKKVAWQGLWSRLKDFVPDEEERRRLFAKHGIRPLERGRFNKFSHLDLGYAEIAERKGNMDAAMRSLSRRLAEKTEVLRQLRNRATYQTTVFGPRTAKETLHRERKAREDAQKELENLEEGIGELGLDDGDASEILLPMMDAHRNFASQLRETAADFQDEWNRLEISEGEYNAEVAARIVQQQKEREATATLAEHYRHGGVAGLLQHAKAMKVGLGEANLRKQQAIARANLEYREAEERAARMERTAAILHEVA